MKTTIYLVRHGEAEGNLCRRMHGHYDSNLTCRGLQQVRALKERFAQLPVDVCYSSDLARAKNTAQAVSIPHGLPLHLEPAFREVAVGCWEDRSFGSLQLFDEEKMQHFLRDPVHWVVDGGETYECYTGRFLSALDRLVQVHWGQTIAIVTHSVIMKAVLQRLFPELPIPHSANTSVTQLEWEQGHYRLTMLNDSSHLSEALSRPPRRLERETIWFRAGWTELPLDAPKTGITYTVMQEHTPIGLVCLELRPPEGIVSYIGLLPQWRGWGLGVRLIGKAISVLRANKMEKMVLCGEESAEMLALWKKLPFEQKGSGCWTLDLRPQIREF